MAGQEVEPVVQVLAKNDLGRPMPNFASQGSLLVVVGASLFHLIAATRLRMLGHEMERPSNARKREMLFPTAHQLSHEHVPLAVPAPEARAPRGWQPL